MSTSARDGPERLARPGVSRHGVGGVPADIEPPPPREHLLEPIDAAV